MDRLKSRDWPGNVRELERVIKRSVLVARGPLLTTHDLSFDQETGAATDVGRGLLDNLLSALDAQAALLVDAAAHGEADVAVHELAMGRLELALIRAALAATAGNEVAAARLLHDQPQHSSLQGRRVIQTGQFSASGWQILISL